MTHPRATDVRLARRYLVIALEQQKLRIVRRRGEGFTWREIAYQEGLHSRTVWRIYADAMREAERDKPDATPAREEKDGTA